MEKHGIVMVKIELVIPQKHLRSKEDIADFLNHMLYTDPEFFGDFGTENVEVLHQDIDKM